MSDDESSHDVLNGLALGTVLALLTILGVNVLGSWERLPGLDLEGLRSLIQLFR
jgi:hypothetical protein